jgi:hypothetical protein
LAVARLGHDRHLSGLHRPGGGGSVDRVGLAQVAPGLAVGPVDLLDDLALGGKEAGQGGAGGAGALHAPGDDLAEPPRPDEQVVVAGGGGGDLHGVHAAAELVGCVGDVDLQVGVDPDGELGRGGVCHAGDGRLLSFAGGDGTRAGRADNPARGLGDRLAAGHVRPVGVPVVVAARADRSDSRHQAGG